MSVRLRMRRSSKISHQDLLSQWRETPGWGNEPFRYIDKKAWSDALVDVMKRYAKPTDSFLEVGCNVGRNLHYLYEAGFHDLSAVEINPSALELLRKTYPDTAARATLYEGAAEDLLPRLWPYGVIYSWPYDVIYSLSVLQHIHPAAIKDVIENIAWLAQKLIVTFENEKNDSDTNWPRDYGRRFGRHGFKTVEKIPFGIDTIRVMQRV